MDVAFTNVKFLNLQLTVIKDPKYAACKSLSTQHIYCDCLKIISSAKMLFTQNIKTVNGNWTSMKLSEIFILKTGLDESRFLK